MKKHIFLFALVLTNMALLANDTLRVKTSINEVTFLLKGASIQTDFRAKIPSGESILVIQNLPSSLDPTSIRIKTPEHIRVASVEPVVNPNTLPPTVLKDIDDKRQQIQGTQLKLQNRLKALEKEKSLLETNSNIKGQQTLSREQLRIVADFYRSRMKEIFNEELDIQYEMHDLRNQLDVLDDTLKARQARVKPFGEILVNLKSTKSALANFQVTGYIPNAGWYAAYELLVPSKTEPMMLIHKAVVKQNTDRTWKNIKAGVSNANPTLTNEKPEMRVWYVHQSKPNYGSGKRSIQQMAKPGTVHGRIIDEHGSPVPFANLVLSTNGKQVSGTISDNNGYFKIRNIKPGSYSITASSVGYEKIRQRISVNAGQPRYVTLRLSSSAIQLDEIAIKEHKTPQRSKSRRSAAKYGGVMEEEVTAPASKIESQNAIGISSVEQTNRIEYRFDKPYTIPSNNREKQIELKTTTIEAKYQYRALPEFADEAFLIAEIPGWEKIQLLEGEAAIFFENTWVGSTLLSPQKTTDTLKLSIARDPSIVVKKELKKQEINRTLLGKDKDETFEWEISIKNTKNYPVTITIEDQIPVSTIKDKTIEILEKSGAKHEKDKGFLFWDVDLEAGASKKLNIKYRIEL